MESMPVTPQQAASTIEGLQFVTDAALSPGGQHVCWLYSEIDEGEEFVELRITGTGSAVAPDPGEAVWRGVGAHGLAWSPSGRTIAFAAATEGRAQLHLLDVATGDVRIADTVEQGVSSGPVWSPNGDLLAFTASTSRHDPTAPYRVTRVVGWRDGIGLVDDALSDIHVLDVRSGVVTRLTDDDWMNGRPVWNDAGTEIVFCSSSGPDDWKPSTRIRTVSLTGETRTLSTQSDVLGVTLVGETLVSTSTGSSLDGKGSLGALWTLGADGTRTSRTEGFDVNVNGDVIGDLPVPYANPAPRILRHQGDVLVRVHRGPHIEIHRVTVSGEKSVVPVVATDGCAYPLDIAAGKLLYAYGTRSATPDLRVLDLNTGVDTPVTDTAAANAARLRPTDVAHFTVAGGEFDVHAVFVSPRDTEKPLPTVLLVHGGPEASFGEVFFADAQLLCEAGFGVLMADPRGARGYGVDFMNAIAGRWGGPDFDDLMAVVDHAVALGYCDPDHLGISGLSYGGFMTTWAVTHTDRFRAAVAENPVTNFVSFAGTSDVGLAFVPTIMDSEITDPTSSLRSSPALAAAVCVTPILLVVGESDRRCPPEQALQFYSRIRHAGCTAELLMLPGEAHEGSISGRPVSRRAQNEALVEWMQRYL